MADENMNQGGGATAAQDDLESSKTHAKRAVADLKEATTAMAEDYRDKAAQAWDDAKLQVRTLREDGEDYVRVNPMRAVFATLGIGFVLGWIIRR